MHSITFVAFVTLVTLPRGAPTNPTWRLLGPPRRAVRAVEGYDGPKSKSNPSQIQPKANRIKSKSSPNPNQDRNLARILVEILGNPKEIYNRRTGDPRKSLESSKSMINHSSFVVPRTSLAPLARPPPGALPAAPRGPGLVSIWLQPAAPLPEFPASPRGPPEGG